MKVNREEITKCSIIHIFSPLNRRKTSPSLGKKPSLAKQMLLRSNRGPQRHNCVFLSADITYLGTYIHYVPKVCSIPKHANSLTSPLPHTQYVHWILCEILQLGGFALSMVQAHKGSEDHSIKR